MTTNFVGWVSTLARREVAMRRERLAGIACALGSVLLFSGFTLASRLGFSSALTLPDLAFLRFGVGGLLLLPVLLRHGLRGVDWREAVRLAFLGGLGFALLAYAGFRLAPAAHGAVLLHGTLPLTTHLVARAVERRSRSPRRTVSAAVIGAGVALVAADSLAAASPRQLLGDGLLLLASLWWSAYGVWSRRSRLPPAVRAAAVAVVSAVAYLPVYALLPGKALLRVGGGELALQALVQGVLVGAVSIFVYTRAVALLGAAETALFAAAVPGLTTLAAIPLLGEVPTWTTLAGLAIVTAGMWIALARAPVPGPVT